MDESRFFRKVAASLIVIPILALVLGEAFTHAYNLELDASVPERLAFTFSKPLIFGLVAVIEAIMISVAFAILRPLKLWLASGRGKEGEAYARARRSAVSIPWTLIAITTGFWTAGTLAFYAINGWKAPGGTPLGWVLAFKISEGLMFAMLSANAINLILLGPKRLLEMKSVGEDERDAYITHRETITLACSIVTLAVHLAYVARFFAEREAAQRGPDSLGLSFAVVSLLVVALALATSLLARIERRRQTDLLVRRIAELSSRSEVDLSEKAVILNFDEIGLVADAFNGYADTLGSMVAEIGNATGTLKSTRAELERSVSAAERAMAEMSLSVREINAHAEDEAASVESANGAIATIGGSMESLRSAIESQAAMVEESSAGIEQMVSNIQSVTANVEQVKSRYAELVAAAESGKTEIARANEDVTKVSQMSSLLLDANKVIAGIAAQTNLLAMNAAIEAAHAGDSGAGFSVVADEIRNLAEKSAQQSKDVGARLKEIKHSIDGAVKASQEAARGFDAVADLIQVVNRFEDEIRSAMNEQSSGSREVIEALASMNGVTGNVNAGAHEIAGGTASLREGMARLSDMASKTRAEISSVAADMAKMREAYSSILTMIARNAEAVQIVDASVGKFKVNGSKMA